MVHDDSDGELNKSLATLKLHIVGFDLVVQYVRIFQTIFYLISVYIRRATVKKATQP